jgi:hypothetical protein
MSQLKALIGTMSSKTYKEDSNRLKSKENKKYLKLVTNGIQYSQYLKSLLLPHRREHLKDLKNRHMIMKPKSVCSNQELIVMW